MEDTLRVQVFSVKRIESRLNPCFNGRYSQSGPTDLGVVTFDVLILVLMEDTLRGERKSVS